MNSALVPRTPDPSANEVEPELTAGVPPMAHGETMRLDLYDNSTFDRGASRLKEALWVICKGLFFLNSLPWPSALRASLLRLFGARIGRGLVIRSGVNITFPWRLTVGNHVWIGEEVVLLTLAPVTIGSQVCLSQRAFLCTGSHVWHRREFDLETRPIELADGVWISAMAFVGPGVKIGEGSVVSAATVVMKSAPAGCLVKGNPGMCFDKQSREPVSPL